MWSIRANVADPWSEPFASLWIALLPPFLTQVSIGSVAVLAAIVAVTMPFSWMAARALTALRLGEDRALSAGVDVGRLRFFSLLRARLLSAAAVAFVGVIGFVGWSGRTSRGCSSARITGSIFPPAC